MVDIRLASDDLAETLDAPHAAVVATRLAELMGLYHRAPGQTIDRRTVSEVIRAAAGHGLAEGLAARVDPSGADDSAVFELLRSLRQSPSPAAEIPSLTGILGAATVQSLVGASDASLRRYAAEDREAPDPVAQRVHYVATLVAILRGSFNEFGIRRWFDRPNPFLSGRAPATCLPGTFDPDDRGPREVLRAAGELLG
jgi:hypothetical protein